MRIKLDENLPAGLSQELSRLGHDVHTSPGEGLTGRSDDAVWSAAQQERRFFLTQDMDFSDVRRFAPGTHHGLMLVRLRHPTRRILIERVRVVFGSEDVAAWAHCFVVVTERKVRIRKPSEPP